MFFLSYLLFVRHIGLTIRISTMKMTAAIMIAARVALGMKEKKGVKKSSDSMTMAPV